MTIYLPSSGDFDARISAGVGELNIYIPAGTAIRISANTGLGSVNVNGDFDRNGNVYYSQDFDSSEDFIDLFVSGGVGSINIRDLD